MVDAADEADDGWIGPVRGLIRVEMFKRSMNYAGLSKALAVVGVDENERNLRNKIARGTFSAVFFVQCMVAIGVTSVPLDAELYPKRKPDQPKVKPTEYPPEYAEMRKPKGKNWVRVPLDQDKLK